MAANLEIVEWTVSVDDVERFLELGIKHNVTLYKFVDQVTPTAIQLSVFKPNNSMEYDAFASEFRPAMASSDV